MFSKLMDKKKGKSMDPNYKAAKMSTLSALRDEMSGMMKDDLSNAKNGKTNEIDVGNSNGMKKPGALVEASKTMVAGPSENPASGMDSEDAQEGDEADTGSDDAVSLIQELVDHEASEGDLTPDKIDALIDMLQSKKQDMSGNGSKGMM